MQGDERRIKYNGMRTQRSMYTSMCTQRSSSDSGTGRTLHAQRPSPSYTGAGNFLFTAATSSAVAPASANVSWAIRSPTDTFVRPTEHQGSPSYAVRPASSGGYGAMARLTPSPPHLAPLLTCLQQQQQFSHPLSYSDHPESPLRFEWTLIHDSTMGYPIPAPLMRTETSAQLTLKRCNDSALRAGFPEEAGTFEVPFAVQQHRQQRKVAIVAIAVQLRCWKRRLKTSRRGKEVERARAKGSSESYRCLCSCLLLSALLHFRRRYVASLIVPRICCCFRFPFSFPCRHRSLSNVPLARFLHPFLLLLHSLSFFPRWIGVSPVCLPLLSPTGSESGCDHERGNQSAAGTKHGAIRSIAEEGEGARSGSALLFQRG